MLRQGADQHSVVCRRRRLECIWTKLIQIALVQPLRGNPHHFRWIVVVARVSHPKSTQLVEPLRSAEANGNYRILAKTFCLGLVN